MKPGMQLVKIEVIEKISGMKTCLSYFNAVSKDTLKSFYQQNCKSLPIDSA